jgi:hypothetical protein
MAMMIWCSFLPGTKKELSQITVEEGAIGDV